MPSQTTKIETHNGGGKTIATSRYTTWLIGAIVLWVTAIGLGWWTVTAYEFKHEPSTLSAALGTWPGATKIKLAGDRPTMVYFMHPKCPCTRASLAELERLWFVAQRREGKRAPALFIVATVPADAAEDWLTTDTLEQARSLGGATVVIDPDGQEARRFGAATSGAVKWFDSAGNCLYSGGITGARGHQGSNAGSDAVKFLLNGGKNPVVGLPPFGCRLCLPRAEGTT